MKYNTRCSICNKVSAENIQTNLGDFTKEEFVPDPKDEKFYICSECKEIHEELMASYEAQDDPYSWIDPEIDEEIPTKVNHVQED